MVDYFKSEKINTAVTAIRSRSGEIMYLIEGLEKAILIDTCVGIKEFRNFVENLTRKPITVLITHGHMDHAMGASEFEDVYMNSLDRDVYFNHRNLERRKEYVTSCIGKQEEWMHNAMNFVPETEPLFKELKDGAIFDLGREHVEVYSLGGHTKGTMVMLLPEERILITGDACNNATFLFDEYSLSVEEYRENLICIEKKLEGRFDRCFMMHHDMEASKDLLKNVIEVCDTIMDGKADDMEFNFMGNINYVAKRAPPQFIREDGGEGNIVYNKKKVMKMV